MRKIGFIFILIISTLPLWGQFNKLPPKEIDVSQSGSLIKTNPLAVLWGPIPYTAEYRLVYETLVLPKQSLLVGASYLGKSMLLTLLEMSDSTSQYQSKILVTGFRLQFDYRFYFKNKQQRPWGFYIAPHFSFSKAKLYTDFYGKQNYYNEFRYLDYGIIVGNQKVVGNSAADFWIGLGTKRHWVYWVESNKIEKQDDFDIIIPYIKIYFGFNFGFSL